MSSFCLINVLNYIKKYYIIYSKYMVLYTCPRCGFESANKSKYTSHLSRKFICKNISSNDNLNNEYIKYEMTEKISYPKNTPNSPILTHGDPFLTPKYSNNRCKYCEKFYSKKCHLTRHLKNCKEKIKDEENKQNVLNLVDLLNKQLEQKDFMNKQMIEQLEEQREQIKEQNHQIKELIKKAGINIGTQNNNIQNNIQILAYGNSDISHLTDKDYLKCLKHSNFCIPHLIKQIHFNPKKPENHNIYISNLKNNYVMIYNGNKWMLNDRDDSIQNLIDDKESIIEQKLEEWIENGNKYPDIMKKFNKYLEKKENDKIINKVKSEIKLMLFNNRDIM